MSAQLRLLDPRTRSVRAGDRVTCAYRGEHRGTVLGVLDLRAWRDTIAFAGREPTEETVRAHIAAFTGPFVRRGLPLPGDWTAIAPVLWDFGKVLWDRVDSLRLAQQEGV